MSKILLLLHLINLNTYLAYDYEAISDDELFFANCDKEDNVGNIMLTDIIDISGLKITENGNGELYYTNGVIKVKNTIPTGQTIKANIEIMSWTRGQWVDTIFSIRRDNFCDAVFSYGELWSSFTMTIPAEQRECPPKAGKMFDVQNLTNRVQLNGIPKSNLAGRYKAVMHLTVAHYSLCLKATVNFYRNN